MIFGLPLSATTPKPSDDRWKSMAVMLVPASRRIIWTSDNTMLKGQQWAGKPCGGAEPTFVNQTTGKIHGKRNHVRGIKSVKQAEERREAWAEELLSNVFVRRFPLRIGSPWESREIEVKDVEQHDEHYSVITTTDGKEIWAKGPAHLVFSRVPAFYNATPFRALTTFRLCGRFSGDSFFGTVEILMDPDFSEASLDECYQRFFGEMTWRKRIVPPPSPGFTPVA